MRKIILIGFALSAAPMFCERAGATEFEWCRLARGEGGRECNYHTFAQCAMMTERLNGGGCVENPFGPSRPPLEARGAAVHHHVAGRKSRHDDANRQR